MYYSKFKKLLILNQLLIICLIKFYGFFIQNYQILTQSYKIKFKLPLNKIKAQYLKVLNMHSIHHQLINQESANSQQNLRNRATVKKQLPYRSIRFNQMYGKQNQIRHSNLIKNIVGKDTVRKHNQSLQQNNLNNTEVCANHLERKAQFMVKIDDEKLLYCKKCATHIASQGFDVHKIITSPIHSLNQPAGTQRNHPIISQRQILLPNISPSRMRKSLSDRNQRINNQKISQLLELVSSLKTLKSGYLDKVSELDGICRSFDLQKKTLIDYYSQLIGYMEMIRDSHLQAIQETSIQAVQVCQIQNGQIEQTINQIQEMVKDIQNNMEKIIDEVDEHSYAECYRFYKQKQGIFSHRLEQLGTEAKPWPCTSQSQILEKIHDFKQFVNQLHEVHDDSSIQQNHVQSYLY